MRMDNAWFSDRVRALEGGMFALAMSYMKQEDDALDCIQQSILKAYEHLDSLREPEKFKSWIYGILVNCCRDELRRRSREGCSLPEEAEQAAPEAPVCTETKTVLWNAVQSLSEPCRTILILFYYEDLPTKEIASVVGIRDAAVRKQLERGRSLLRAALEKEGFHETE